MPLLLHYTNLDIINAMCSINDGIEDTHHILLLHHSLELHNCILFIVTHTVLQNDGYFAWNGSFLQHLLFGDENHS